MGLSAVLEDEAGVELGRTDDPTNILHRILPSAEDPSSPLLRFIDWYGDTTFNRLQMDTVIHELSGLKSSIAGKVPEAVGILDRIVNLAARCKNESHCYLKFYGD